MAVDVQKLNGSNSIELLCYIWADVIRPYMKKTILLILAAISLSCSSDGSHPDALVGKWIIYKAAYENTVYEYEITGQCGKESLEMKSDNNYNFVTETYYSNEDCTGFTSNTEWNWVNEGEGVYSIYPIGQTVPERTVILTDNEIKVTTPGFITVTKYYRRVQ